MLVFLSFWQFSRELKETGSSGACELKSWFCNFTLISLVLFLYVSKIYNIVMVICLNQQQNANESQIGIECLIVRWRKSTEHKLYKIWRSLKFCKNSGKRAHFWQIEKQNVVLDIHQLISLKCPQIKQITTIFVCISRKLGTGVWW